MLVHATSEKSNSSSFIDRKKQKPFFSPVIIQRKLTIGPVDDAYEREADAMADKVMRMSDGETLQTKPSPINIQRKCAHCEEEEKLQRKEDNEDNQLLYRKPIAHLPVQRKCAACEEEEKNIQPKKSTGSSVPAVTPSVNQALQSSGHSLEIGTRSFMESRFGYDFSNVQIHNDSLAHQSSADIHALAYTHDRHIVFGTGQYQPNTFLGKKLLAHELTHVVQQNKGISGIHRKDCTEGSFKTQTYVSVANENDFAPLDGYTPIKGEMHDILSDGKRKFFCYKDKKIYIKYNVDGRELIPDLAATYPVKIENGDKGWSQSDLAKISEALGKLSLKEISLLKGYRLVRRKGAGFLVGEDQIGVGLTTHDVVTNDYEIEFWDPIFDGSADKEIKPLPGTSPGVPSIIHEFGHVVEFGRMKPINVALYNYEEFRKLYDKASPDKRKEMEFKLKELEAVYDKETKTLGQKPLVETDFEKLTKGKQALTDYSKSDEEEAFAEAFAMFKINPKLLKSKNLKLYQYFKREGFL